MQALITFVAALLRFGRQETGLAFVRQAPDRASIAMGIRPWLIDDLVVM